MKYDCLTDEIKCNEEKKLSVKILVIVINPQ